MTNPHPPHIVTDRLLLVAATADHLRAELQSFRILGSLLDAEVPSDWPPGEYDRDAQEFFLERLEFGGPDVVGWYCWYAIQRDTSEEVRAVVGSGGFLGPPNSSGEIELGFSIAPAWRERGYATELVKGLAARAFNDVRVLRIVAQTTPGNLASRRVLEHAGFARAEDSGGSESVRFEMHAPMTHTDTFLRGEAPSIPG